MIDIKDGLYHCVDKVDLKDLVQRLGTERDGIADRLRETADLMADLGRIHNTPQAKRQWIDRIVAG